MTTHKQIGFETKKIFTSIQKIESEAIFPLYYRNEIIPYLKELYSINTWNTRTDKKSGLPYKEDIYDYFNDNLKNILKTKTKKVYYKGKKYTISSKDCKKLFTFSKVAHTETRIKFRKDSKHYYLKSEIDSNKLTSKEYAFLLFFNILFDKKLHKYMPFYISENWDGYIYKDVIFLLVDNATDDELDWHLHNTFDRNSLKLATRFFQYHLKDSSLNPKIATTLYDYSKASKYISNVSKIDSYRRTQKYIVYLDFLLFDLIKLENDVRIKIKDGNYDLGINYYKLVTLIHIVRHDLQDNNYYTYLNLNDFPWKKLPFIDNSIKENSSFVSSNLYYNTDELGLDDEFNLENAVALETLEYIDPDRIVTVSDIENLPIIREIDDIIFTLPIHSDIENKEEAIHILKINRASMVGIQKALIIRQLLKSRPFNIISETLSLTSIYKELHLNKTLIKKNQMLSFFSYYCNDINKKDSLLDLINSCRKQEFKTSKELEAHYINQRLIEVKKLYLRGLTLSEISKTLDVSLRTIKYDFSKIKITEFEKQINKENKKVQRRLKIKLL